MKKRFLAGVLSLGLFIAAFTACGKDTENTSEPEGQDTEPAEEEAVSENTYGDDVIVMRVGHAQTEESPRHRSLLTFKEEVEKKSNGGIVVEIYPNGELGAETEMTVKVTEGSLEAVRGGDVEFLPQTELLSLPMIADDLEQARELCYSDYLADLLSGVEDYGLKVLAVGDDSGMRQITNNVHPIRTPEDVKGLRIRTPQIVITELFFEELGAKTEVVAFTDLYDKLAEGAVDGQENPLALIDSSHFYEVQKYCTIIDYQFFPEFMYVNLEWWNGLSSEQQDILSAAARSMMDENARITDEENAKYIRHIRENGCEIISLSDEERAAFEEYAKRSWQKYIDSGYSTEAEFKQMLAVIGKTVEW